MSSDDQRSYLGNLLKTLSQSQGHALPWLNQLRLEAIDHVGTKNLPTTRDEEWRFTDISPLSKLPYQPAPQASKLQAIDIEDFYIDEATTRLVFVDGHYESALSNIPESVNITVGNMSELAETHAETIQAHLGQHAQSQDSVFTALNTAFLHDGALIILPRNTVCDTPIHLLFVATQQETTNYPRCLLIGEPSSQATVIEDYVTHQDASYITNAITEISLAENAHIHHARVQRENNAAYHIARCVVSLAHASHYQSISVALGARISRYDLNVKLTDETSECKIDGLALIAGEQLADTHTRIDHLKPHGTSHQQHKCIVDDAAHAVFNGKIMVHPKAQLTNSTQSSRNLLLTDRAHVDTKPQLEIFADDVKCAHGATVGQLDNEEIFYLKSRGLSESSARDLLTYAFAAEIIDRISVPSLKQKLEQTVLKRTQSTMK